jgi:EmrB/QacA subfamily drug resistance transporter
MQGVGGGMLTPVGTAMLFRAFPPEERAKASAVLVIPIAVSPALGPIIGGYLVEYHEWRWIFLINIPIGVLGLIVSGIFLREERQPSTGAFDVPGFLLGASGLASIVYALAEAGAHGFTDPKVVGFGMAGIALMTAFTLVELRVEHPMLDVRLFKDSLFRACNAISVASSGGLIGAIFLLPLLLQSQMGFSPFEAGLTTFPQAVGVSIMAPIAGQIYMRVGPRRMLAFGMFVSMVTSLAFVAIDIDTSVWAIAFVLLLRGMGFGVALIPLQAATYATISPRDTGRATAITNVVFQVAGALGVALLATVLTNRLDAYGATLGDPAVSDEAFAAFHDAFIASAALSAVAAIIALVLVDDRKAAHTMQRDVAPAAH